ncbi:MAG: DNA repair protein RecO [Candidatus Levybacteria bacterium]|nr:DNA repair protein RecO [Candidatus Levybacteria bacterium]
MRTFKTEGIIIKRRNIGEADRFLIVFTKNYGKITVKAVGVRKIMSRRSGHVELLNHSVLTLYKSGYGLPILTETQALEDFSEIKRDLTKIGFAYHICELVDGLCPENQDNRAVFSLLFDTLKKLTYSSSEDPELVEGDESRSFNDNSSRRASLARTIRNDILLIIHDFEVELLTILGYWHRPQALSQNLNTQYFIEGILERKLRSRAIFSKLQQ